MFVSYTINNASIVVLKYFFAPNFFSWTETCVFFCVEHGEHSYNSSIDSAQCAYNANAVTIMGCSSNYGDAEQSTE